MLQGTCIRVHVHLTIKLYSFVPFGRKYNSYISVPISKLQNDATLIFAGKDS